MSSRPWYKRYGGDFVLGTMSLTLEEKGAYSLCLDLIYDRGAPIPDDERWLAGVCGVSVRKWRTLRERLVETGKLTALDGVLSNSRAEKEIENAAKTSREHVENGASGGRKRVENATKVNENSDVDQAGLKPRGRVLPEARSQKPEENDLDDHSPVVRLVKPNAFARFWEAYPNKTKKRGAEKLFGPALKRADLAQIMDGLNRAKASRRWREGYVMNPETWLRNDCWLDETDDMEEATGPPRAGVDEDFAAAALERFRQANAK